jgi:hypothetical protein
VNGSASFRVIRHVRPKLACTCCDHIAQASAPSRPIERGLAGPGLLAHVLVAKFADHLPLYRQSVIAREGVELERSTLAKWVGQSAALLQPLVEAIRRHVMAASKLHADDTPVPVLAPGNGTTKTGRLWVYVRDDRASGDTTPAAVWFGYTPDRKGIHPKEHLQPFAGRLQADAYGGYQAIYETGRVAEKRPVGRTRDDSSTSFMRRGRMPSTPRRSSELAHCINSRRTSAASHLTNVGFIARRMPSPCSNSFIPG